MEENQITYYQIPNKDWYRIHFVRPRFKSNIENVLLYMVMSVVEFPSALVLNTAKDILMQ